MVVIITTNRVPSEMGKICVTRNLWQITGRMKCLELELAN